MMKTDVLVVGAGFAGSVMAERVANAGKHVIIIDKREHLAGNAFDRYDSHGILIHVYGPHIFHTKSKKVFDYLSNFTYWTPYKHKVLSFVEGKLLPIPINLDTINKLYNLTLDENGAIEYFEKIRTNRYPEKTSEDVVLNSVGHDLCDKFFRNYTFKQWGSHLHELDASIARRIPVRTNTNDFYFSDKYQMMPADGYSALFKKMLDHPRISIELGLNFNKIRNNIKTKHIVFTGPIDDFFNYSYGALPYRSLRFKHLHYFSKNKYQPVAVVNYPNEYKYTRISEFKHITGQRLNGTSIAKEYPRMQGDPFYPVLTTENLKKYYHYYKLAKAESKVTFIGRLAEYRYYNMDQVVLTALRRYKYVLATIGN